MAKIIKVSEFNINDIEREEHNYRVWYSEPNDEHEDAVDIIPNHFYSWLDESGHLQQGYYYPYDQYATHPEYFPLTLSHHDFWLEDPQKFIYPIVKEYLLKQRDDKTFNGVSNAVKNITSQHKKKS